MVWTQLLTLDGEHRLCEPKRLRYRILHVLGRSPATPDESRCASPPRDRQDHPE